MEKKVSSGINNHGKNNVVAQDIAPEQLAEENNTEEQSFAPEKSVQKNDKDDFEGMYKRALADYQNLLKQSVKEKSEFIHYANEKLLLEIIPVYNNLRLSLIHTDENNSWLEGIGHIVRQFKNALENVGVEEIKTIGEEFDHNLMEAVNQEDTDDEKLDNIVAKELQFGYKLNNKVIIPARVSVYKHKV